jgi:hypothetical protein
MAEQIFTARNIARVLQEAIPSEFYLATIASDRFNGRHLSDNKFNGEGFFDGKKRSLWKSVRWTQSYAKNHISHRDKIFAGMIGFNFSNFDDKFFGIFVGFSDADINCTGQNSGTSGQQSGVNVGAYGAIALSDEFAVSYSSMIWYARFRCDQNLKNADYGPRNLRAHSKYYGISYFNKLSLMYAFQSGRYTFYPEISLHFDWVGQSTHDVKVGEETLFRRTGVRGFYVSYEIGMRCRAVGWRGHRGIYPDIFVGYEFDMSRHGASLQQDIPETRRMDHLVTKIGLILHLSNKLCANAWYIGNYNKNFGLSGVSMGITYNF